MTPMFNFDFSDYRDASGGEISYQFAFPESTNEQLRAIVNEMNDAYMEVLEDMESEYGTIDQYGSDDIVAGFSSAEIEKQHHETCVAKWKAFFEAQGIKTGDTQIKLLPSTPD